MEQPSPLKRDFLESSYKTTASTSLVIILSYIIFLPEGNILLFGKKGRMNLGTGNQQPLSHALCEHQKMNKYLLTDQVMGEIFRVLEQSQTGLSEVWPGRSLDAHGKPTWPLSQSQESSRSRVERAMPLCLLEGLLDDASVECTRIWSNVTDSRYMYVVVEVCILPLTVSHTNPCTGTLEHLYLEASSPRQGHLLHSTVIQNQGVRHGASARKFEPLNWDRAGQSTPVSSWRGQAHPAPCRFCQTCLSKCSSSVFLPALNTRTKERVLQEEK